MNGLLPRRRERDESPLLPIRKRQKRQKRRNRPLESLNKDRQRGLLLAKYKRQKAESLLRSLSQPLPSERPVSQLKHHDLQEISRISLYPLTSQT